MSAEKRPVVWNPPATVHPSQLHAPLPPEYIYTDPIPPVTTQTPGELLENFYAKKHNQPDRTDPKDLRSVQLEVHLKYPQNAVVPVGSSGLVGKWPRPDGLAAEPVPVDGVALEEPQRVIEFRNLDPECPSEGTPMSALYVMNTEVLRGAWDIILNGSRVKDLKLVIAWPGYKPHRFPIGTVANDGTPLTRFKLGWLIAMAYARVFMKVEDQMLLPSKPSFYNIALHQGLKKRSDSLGVQLTQLHLVRFRGTTGGNWVADVDIV